MKYRKLDANGDYILGNNAQGFLTGADAVAQAITTNLKLLQAEWWENVDQGLPLFQNILGQPGTPDNIKAADLIIQDNILSTTNVKSIANFQSNYSNRTYTIQCMVNTTFGSVAVTVTF